MVKSLSVINRYGYRDLHKKDDGFETNLFDNLFLFVRLEPTMEAWSESEVYSNLHGLTVTSVESMMLSSDESDANSIISFGCRSIQTQPEMQELEFLRTCKDAGVVHILGNTSIRARKGSRLFKRIAIDYIYAFLRKICRENSVIFNVPHESLLNIGQVFYV